MVSFRARKEFGKPKPEFVATVVLGVIRKDRGQYRTTPYQVAIAAANPKSSRIKPGNKRRGNTNCHLRKVQK